MQDIADRLASHSAFVPGRAIIATLCSKAAAMIVRSLRCFPLVCWHQVTRLAPPPLQSLTGQLSCIQYTKMGKAELKKLPDKLTDSEKKKLKNENVRSLTSSPFAPPSTLSPTPPLVA